MENKEINIKEFKMMIKKHQCKQSFVRIIDGHDKHILNRFYQDTTNNKKYVCCWQIEDDELTCVVFEIDTGVWAYNWHKYTAECLQVRQDEDATAESIAVSADNAINRPMQERKFWKIKTETLRFMLKDQRVVNE